MAVKPFSPAEAERVAAAKKQKMKMKAAALAKLNPEERAALGIKE
jgi:formylmethanofuran dehydrogenase subunit D